jgi:hypothetical protein
MHIDLSSRRDELSQRVGFNPCGILHRHTSPLMVIFAASDGSELGKQAGRWQCVYRGHWEVRIVTQNDTLTISMFQSIDSRISHE